MRAWPMTLLLLLAAARADAIRLLADGSAGGLAQCPFTLMQGTDLAGGDLETGEPAADAAECCARCAARSECSAWQAGLALLPPACLPL